MAPMGQARFLHSSAALDGYLVSEILLKYLGCIYCNDRYLSMLLAAWLM